MSYPLSTMEADARAVLNDLVQVSGAYRYSSVDIYQAFNEALMMARAKRPDAFLDMGLRNTVPQYSSVTDTAVLFPLDMAYYPAFLFYVVGRTELREDTFTDDNRAVSLMNKYVSLLLSVQS